MPNAQPAVTVVIPAYRTAHTLKAAVDSVLNQTMQDFEVVIVEDFSQDDTLSVARRLEVSDPRVRVIALPENGGHARARNRGTAAAKGRWIAVLDADDVYLPERLDVLVGYGEAQGADLVADNQNHVDAKAGLVGTAFPASEGGRFLTMKDFIENNSTKSEFSLGILKPVIRADFIRQHGLSYREGVKLGEDFYHLMQFFAAGGRGFLVNRPYYVWTMPFGPVSREWTTTGLGAWRYDYSTTIEANRHFTVLMRAAGQSQLVHLLQRREREYHVMQRYISAQRTMAETGSRVRAAGMIARHPSTWPLLVKRVHGRLNRALRTSRPPGS